MFEVPLLFWKKIKDDERYFSEGLTTNRAKGYYNYYSPSTFEKNKFTRHAYGESINLSMDELYDLADKNPKAYIHFLITSGYTAWLQVRNIRVRVTKITKTLE